MKYKNGKNIKLEFFNTYSILLATCSNMIHIAVNVPILCELNSYLNVNVIQ